MYKVYISGPMTNDPDFVRKFKKAEATLKQHNCIVLNPVIWTVNNLELSYADYMTLDLAMLSICDYMVLLPGYEASKGCSIEIEFAKNRNIITMDMSEFIKEVAK